MRTIKYMKKITSARTIYVDISASDQVWLRDQLRNLDRFLTQVKAAGIPRGTDFDQFYQLDSDLPRRGQAPYGPNSVYSLVRGVVSNMDSGTQRDFSLPTLHGLARCINLANDVMHGFESVEFIDAQAPQPAARSTFEDLFDLGTYEITVTIRKRNDQKK